MELIAEIYLPAGMLLTAGIKELEPVINDYKKTLHKAGREIAANLKLSGETQKSLEKNSVPVDAYIQGCNKMMDMILANAKTSNQSVQTLCERDRIAKHRAAFEELAKWNA